MGSHDGGGYTSTPSGVEVLVANIDRLSERFPLTPGGRFGRRGKNTQVVECENPAATAREFWTALSMGASPAPLPNRKGDLVYFEDGSRVVHRTRTSTVDSPTVEIFVSTRGLGLPPRQKIHFITKGPLK